VSRQVVRVHNVHPGISSSSSSGSGKRDYHYEDDGGRVGAGCDPPCGGEGAPGSVTNTRGLPPVGGGDNGGGGGGGGRRASWVAYRRGSKVHRKVVLANPKAAAAAAAAAGPPAGSYCEENACLDAEIREAHAKALAEGGGVEAVGVAGIDVYISACTALRAVKGRGNNNNNNNSNDNNNQGGGSDGCSRSNDNARAIPGGGQQQGAIRIECVCGDPSHDIVAVKEGYATQFPQLRGPSFVALRKKTTATFRSSGRNRADPRGRTPASSSSSSVCRQGLIHDGGVAGRRAIRVRLRDFVQVLGYAS
jgi:hypothetical protein